MMKAITWDGSLAVGIPLIDEQHKELMSRLNATSKAIAEGEGEREIQRTLGFLIDYTKYHFGAEEKVMEEASYPSLADHKRRHVEFIGILEQMEEEFREEGATKSLAESLHTLLYNWLAGHIGTVDLEFARFAQRAQA